MERLAAIALAPLRRGMQARNGLRGTVDWLGISTVMRFFQSRVLPARIENPLPNQNRGREEEVRSGIGLRNLAQKGDSC
jgi:hypothetical protein